VPPSDALRGRLLLVCKFSINCLIDCFLVALAWFPHCLGVFSCISSPLYLLDTTLLINVHAAHVSMRDLNLSPKVLDMVCSAAWVVGRMSGQEVLCCTVVGGLGLLQFDGHVMTKQ
jgi:hypothetical protein